MDLYVFTFDFERIGIIDSYQSINAAPNYRYHSGLDLVVDATPEMVDWFINKSDEVILTKEDDTTHGFIVDIVKFTDETKATIEVYCKSLGYLLNRRTIGNQQTFKGTVENTLRYFVTNNAISPSNPNRIISNLVLGPLNGLNTLADEAISGKYLDEALWEICLKFDVAYDILLDVYNKKLVFTVWQGIDRTTEQSQRDAVIFSKSFDNVLNQNFLDDKSTYKNVAIVAGEGEGAARKVLIVNDTITGLERREIFVDARDLQSVREDESVMTSQEYNDMLTERGKTELAEYERVQTFETNVDYNSQFIYGSDYSCGDKVTIRNDELGIVMHTRVVKTNEVYTKNGFELSIEFGSNKPTFLSKLKKAVK